MEDTQSDLNLHLRQTDDVMRQVSNADEVQCTDAAQDIRLDSIIQHAC